MHQPNAGPIAAYNSLCDEHLSEYFASPRRINHLQKMGLITPDRRIMDEETIRARTVQSERKQREEDMIASTIVSEAVNLERKRRAEIKNKLDLLARYEQAEKVKNQKRQPANTSEGLDFSPRLSPRLQLSTFLGSLRKDAPTTLVEPDMQKYLKKISLPNTLPVPRSNPYVLQTPHSSYAAQGSSHAPHSVFVMPASQHPSHMTTGGLLTAQSRYDSQFLSQSSLSIQGPFFPPGSSSSLMASTADMGSMVGFPSTEVFFVHLPHPPATPPCTPVPQEPVVRARWSFVLPRSKTAPARLTRRQAKEGPTEQFKVQSPVRSNVKITLRYLGRCGPVKRFCSNTVEVLQQHCGGNTVSLFKGGLKEKDTFSIVSRRHLGMPFGLSLYVDGLMDCRVSTCCEYKHSPGRLIGPAKQAHFAVVDVEGGAPCPACEKEVQLKAGNPSSAKRTDTAGTTSVQIIVTDEETKRMVGEEKDQKTGDETSFVSGVQTESRPLTPYPRSAQSRDSSTPHNAPSVSNSSTLPTLQDSPEHPSGPSVRASAHPAGGSVAPPHPLTIRHKVAHATHSTRLHRLPIQPYTPSQTPPPPLPSLKMVSSHMPVPSHVAPLQVQPLPPSPHPHPSEIPPPSSHPHPSEIPPPSPHSSEMPHPSEIPPPSSHPHPSEIPPPSPHPHSSEIPPTAQGQSPQILSQLPQESVVPASQAPLCPESLSSQDVPLPLSQVTLSQPLSSQPPLQNPSEQLPMSEAPLAPQTQPVQVQLLSSEVSASQIQQPLAQDSSPQLPPQELLSSQHALPAHAPLEVTSDPTLHNVLPKTSDVAAGPSEVFEETSEHEGAVNDSLLETGEEDDNCTTVYEETEDERDGEVVEREEDTVDGDNESERDSHIEKDGCVEGSAIEIEECEDSEVYREEEDGESEEEPTSSHGEAYEQEASIGTRETDETETEMEDDNEINFSTQGSGFIGVQTSSLRPSNPLPPSSENEFDTATGGRLERSDGGVEVNVVKEQSRALIDTSSEVLNSRTSKAKASTGAEQAVSSTSLHSLTAQNEACSASWTSNRRIGKSDMRNETRRSNADLSCLDSHGSPSHTRKTQHISSYSTSSFESQGEPASKQEEVLRMSDDHHRVPQPICSTEKSGNALQDGAETKKLSSISSHSTRSLVKAVSTLVDEGEAKDMLQEPQFASSNLMEKSGSTLQDRRKSKDTPFCSQEAEQPASTLQVGEMMEGTLASPQEHQPVSSYSASSFEKSATTLHDGTKRNSSIENQTESATALEEEGKTGEDEEDDSVKNGRSSGCSHMSNTLATSTASHNSHSLHSSRHSPPPDTAAVGGSEKHSDRIKNSPFVPDQGSQPLLCQAVPSDQEIKSLRMEKLDRKINIESTSSASLPMVKGSRNNSTILTDHSNDC